MRVSALSRKSCDCGEVLARAKAARDELRRARSSNDARARRPRSSFVKEIRSFSTTAVVIGVRCTSIRMCIVLISPLIIAWRATWRRKRRRQRPRRKRRRRSRLRGLNDAIDSDVESSVEKTGEAEGSAQCCCEWPRRFWSTTEGGGETEVHPSRILDFGLAFTGRLQVLVSLARRSQKQHVACESGKIPDDLSFSPTPSVSSHEDETLERRSHSRAARRGICIFR